MTVEECYEAFGGDYKGVMGRLMKEERVIRFLTKFKNDDMIKPLEEALETQAYEDAFRAAHNLKGVCLNLGINKLGESSSELTESLRGGEPKGDVQGLLAQVREDYELTMVMLDNIL